MAILCLLACLCFLHPAVQAQDWMPGMSTWPGMGSPLGQSALPSMSYPYNIGPPIPSEFARPYSDLAYDAWLAPRNVRPGGDYRERGPADSYQPDLTGNWQGSGGETVQIERNRARIWGGSHQSCSCVFFLVGQRMLAYSPDSDRVRKYWFQQTAPDRFYLIDEAGNQLSFWRVR